MESWLSSKIRPSSHSNGNDFVSRARGEQREIVVDDEDILEIPGAYQSDLSLAKAHEREDRAKAKLTLGFFKLVLPVLAAVVLIAWLAIPRSGLRLTGDRRCRG